ncbi:MAG: hypothetical protein ACRC3J_05250 [Culicoidibacterales bacterium]
MMIDFKSFVDEPLNEKLITFGKRAYPKFNQVVIMAGGGGSGKGFVQKKLMGIEGIVLDVDAVKELAMRSESLAARIKKETGHDIKNFNLRNPEEVATLHMLLSDEYKTTKKMDKRVFNAVLTAEEGRKPNLIFDVTMKDMSKLASIAKQAKDLGYLKQNVHIVWVMNDIKVALEQNANRSRVVPEEILISTHEGASMTFKKLMAMGEGARAWVDGDWWVAFNKKDVDVKLNKSKTGGSYVFDANIIKVKEQGKAPLKAIELDKEVIQKISSYAPDDDIWKLVKV